MRSLAGKKALVTGAASGIGRAISVALANHQVDLYLLDIDGDALNTAVEQVRACGVAAIGRRCDLSQPSEVTAAAHAVLRDWGRLDLLVNNAGMAYYGPTHCMTALQWDQVLSLNLHSPIHMTRELLPTLLEQHDAHILNVCSIAGLVPFRKLAAYQATKFGLVGFSQALRAEYWGRGLGVTALCPGFVRTNIYRSALRNPGSKPLPELPGWLCAAPERVAGKAIRAIQLNKGVVTVAPLATVSYIFQRVTPKAMEILARGRLLPKKARGRLPVAQVMPQAVQGLQAVG